ncbi:hypothetical protein COLO4_03160 [Corchorus olitorius]|uniref:Uncharacterized protein n=1 Tax=Corchorus olitorius TaxID=93759 RepID=A0A1R3KZL8_9ROSI|nr:hypothetical protein COLO4_03160 [Corchorus olitorius]
MPCPFPTIIHLMPFPESALKSQRAVLGVDSERAAKSNSKSASWSFPSKIGSQNKGNVTATLAAKPVNEKLDL